MLNRLAVKAMVKKNEMLERLSKKRTGLDGIVVTAGIILIAVVLIVFFKDKAKDMITSLVNKIDTQITNMGTSL